MNGTASATTSAVSAQRHARKLGMRGRDVDVAIVAQKSVEKPAHPLPPPSALPDLADELGRQVVAIFTRCLGDQRHLVGRDAGFLAKLAQSRDLGILAVVDAALRKLPGLGLGIDTQADEKPAFAIDDDDAGAGAIGQVVGCRQCRRLGNHRLQYSQRTTDVVLARGDRLAQRDEAVDVAHRLAIGGRHAGGDQRGGIGRDPGRGADRAPPSLPAWAACRGGYRGAGRRANGWYRAHRPCRTSSCRPSSAAALR